MGLIYYEALITAQGLPQWRGHGWVWVGSNPPTFKKGTHEIFANPKTFLGVGGGGGRVEREKA